MADMLSHPDTGTQPGRGAPTGRSRWQKLVAILGLVVVLWVGSETYDVVAGDFGGPGPGGGHGPGGPSQDAPLEDQDEGTDTDDGGGHTPPAGGHTPHARGHG